MEEKRDSIKNIVEKTPSSKNDLKSGELKLIEAINKLTEAQERTVKALERSAEALEKMAKLEEQKQQSAVKNTKPQKSQRALADTWLGGV